MRIRGMRVPGAGPLDAAKRSVRMPGGVSRGSGTQGAATGSEHGRHSRLISP